MASGERDPFNLPAGYSIAAERIKDLIEGGPELLNRDLPEGPSSKIGFEYFAREYCRTHPQTDLGIIYAILATTTCVAAQGAFVVQCPIDGGGFMGVPAIQMALGVAPSGWRKSTALDLGMKPLTKALKAGVALRAQECAGRLSDAKQAYNDLQTTHALDDDQFKMVFDAGICPKTLTDDPTQEALRNMIVYNGAHAGVLAAEADIFRNMVAYTQDGGSLTLMLNLWDQRKIDATRVSNPDLHIEEASLVMMVLFQTEVFSDVTSGASRGMNSGSDSFISRGMFGRMWVVETSKTGDHTEVAKGYSDDNDVTFLDPNGYVDADGRMTVLGEAHQSFQQTLDELVAYTNPYRTSKGIRHGWEAARTKYGSDLQVPEQPEAEREQILLDADARLAYRRVQRMQLAIQHYIEEADDEENKALWNPLASRFTQHVIREALTIALASGSTEITGEMIEDAATRIIPWRWCLSANALTRRANERAEDILADAAQTNPRQEDLTPSARVKAILYRLAEEKPQLRAGGLTRDELLDAVRGRFRRASRNSVSKLLNSALAQLTADPTSGVREMQGPPNGIGIPTMRYQVVTTQGVGS